MSKIEEYEKHNFHEKFKYLKEIINNFQVESYTDNEIIKELTLFKKITCHINDYLKLVDPEISNLSCLDVATNHIITSINKVDYFIKNGTKRYILDANSDTIFCLSEIKKLNILLPKINSKSISSMIKTYNDNLEKSLQDIDFKKIKNDIEEIYDLKEELIDGEDNLNDKIENIFESIKEKFNKISETYDEILIDDEKESINTSINNAKEEIFNEIGEIKKSIIESNEHLKQLDEFYVKIFGKFNKDEGKRIGGLNQELDNIKKELNKFDNEQKDKFSILEDKINDLLSGATSAGLAKAYKEERDNFKFPIIIWNAVFVSSLIVISFLSFFALKDLNSVADIIKSILHSLPITVPLIWIAIYSSKRRSENQRLEQEYAHKEALAKSYISYKKEIEELDNEDKEMLINLMQNTIKTITYNASTTLDKKHGDGTILNEILQNVKDIATFKGKSE
ncbi:hypothetical protein [Campylobacter pinnipediorum]|uniref:hypothetical protein n=1 Tax=Campylobacter pinnipediorum TaxID=1965231 RepID=UPI00084DCFDE|nr:hypothetical protein [Campylobacter pinnipediorum]